jgi:Fur family ferric uptake transcriptional regulator
MARGGESMADRCEAQGLRMTDQRRVIAEVLDACDDHPDVEELHRRATARDPAISIATVYRTVKLFEEHGILERLDFRDGRARYEDADRDHHDHLIDVVSGAVIEFVDREIEALQRRVADRYGYELVGHRLELYGRRLPSPAPEARDVKKDQTP